MRTKVAASPDLLARSIASKKSKASVSSRHLLIALMPELGSLSDGPGCRPRRVAPFNHEVVSSAGSAHSEAAPSPLGPYMAALVGFAHIEERARRSRSGVAKANKGGPYKGQSGLGSGSEDVALPAELTTSW